MKSKKSKLLTLVTALIMTFSTSLSVSAKTILDQNNDNGILTGTNSAMLTYNEDDDTYEFYDSSGNLIQKDFSSDVEFKAANETPLVTTAPSSGTDNVKTTAVTSSSETTVTTASSVSVSDTGKWYVARYRSEVLSEIAATSTTKATTTTKKTTTTTKKITTTTKKVYDGIDVSRWQGDIDWKKVKAAGIEFVMIKAGYGKFNDQVDAKFKTNISGAQKVGIDCGVYWYSYAVNTSDALLEAKACCNTIKGYKLSYPVAFDIEDSSQTSLSTTQISNITKVFCDYLESQKYYVTVYSYASFLTSKMNSSVQTKYDVWVAHTNTKKPSYSGSYGMWQYSHTGKVNGINADVDLDYSYKYYPDIMKKNKLNGYT